ncbi:alcohol dehydrogenase catalytic domain-containing protein [Rhodococcus sp. NPDC060090]|uniref:alcohol dehydrogenase catalytic domain-containing protein n=1 Tax=Rhodococcus sp. NPDC060090 TaxID=3347056 RepID=UPI00364D754A
MSRAIVFSGHETWEERELPEPEPPIGGAVLRVEATGLCYSDVDHFRGNIHTSRGGAFPSVPGHEIVSRIDKIRPETAAEPDLRSRLLHPRGVRSARRVRGASRTAPGLESVSTARRSPRRRIDVLRAAELRRHMGGAGTAR